MIRIGYNEPRKRDGSGPYKSSYRRTREGKSYGRRKEAGEECPHEG